MIDRLDDLRAAAGTLARENRRRDRRGTSPLRSPEPSPPPTPQLAPRRSDEPLHGFLAKLERVRRGPLRELEGTLAEAEELHSGALQATTAKEEKKALLKAEACAARASTAASRTCQELRNLASEPQQTGSEAALRRQALAGVSVLFQNALSSYFQLQVAFRQEMEAKVSRQLRAAFPEADDTVVEAVAAGRSAASTIQDAMQRQSGTAPLSTANALQATQERCDELANLARAARDLSQIFVDVESLVNSQGEILNDIGSHIASTREQTALGRDKLREAVAAKTSCRCWMVLGLLLALFIVVLIAAIILSQAHHKQRIHVLKWGNEGNSSSWTIGA
ncbi:unnamed protein product [Effrenium voratum]|uniref:t-SNARE coiled-coil homology domain-containing protein n=1 Tax=Effrenium voratum TaxID=2562239 RepID=A0AA36JBQ9_9DINO|nr:unnamed protein product [Effrenium voratum]